MEVKCGLTTAARITGNYLMQMTMLQKAVFTMNNSSIEDFCLKIENNDRHNYLV